MNACKINVLKIKDFEFLVKKVCMLINKRPIAYRNNLQTFPNDYDFPLCLTPEMIVKGYEVPSLSIMPQLHEEEDQNFYIKEDSQIVWEKVFTSFSKMQKIRRKITSIYLPEFIRNLQTQAMNKKNRYCSKNYVELNKGDLVCIKQTMCKPYNYPLGIVVEVEENSRLSKIIFTDYGSRTTFIASTYFN